jgi:thymidylate kinase
MYKLSKELILTLNKENIKYCHWKSNLLLNEALEGYDDLDILVNKNHVKKFEILILQLGFKRASNTNLEIQSVHHFYGFDIETGEILHLHVYYEIKTGPSWTKSLRFDFEDYVLENTIAHESGMFIPEKHIELVIFIIRIMMKHTKINELILVEDELERTKREIKYLLQGIDKEKIDEFLKLYFPKITLVDFFMYIKVIQKSGLLLKVIYGMKLKRSVKEYLRLSYFSNSLINANQLFYRVFNKLFFRKKKSLATGGGLICIVGLDATGKTTISTELKKWLGKNFSIYEAHFGKPPSTAITIPFNLVIKLLRKIIPIEKELRSGTKSTNKQKSYLYMIRQIILAYDRYILAKKMWAKSSNGVIVICDRYKSNDFGVMDSKRLILENYTGIKRKWAFKENKMYDSMSRPDLIFYLTVPIEIAVQRNTDRIKKGKESEEFLRKRHLENQNLKYRAKYVFKIDTDTNYKNVITEIKAKIWENI